CCGRPSPTTTNGRRCWRGPLRGEATGWRFISLRTTDSPGPARSLIRLDKVTKRYPNGTASVHELSLDVDEGEICVLVGRSGCGKTTTMRMINRLIEPTGGHIYLDGDDVMSMDPVELRRRIGYVIQQIGLFPHQTIGTNIATVPRLLGWPKQKVRARVD